MKFTPATGAAVHRAYSKSAKRIMNEPKTKSAETSAGFIIPDGQPKGPKKGYQVFVKVARFSEALLNSRPGTGGLIENQK